MARAKEYYHLDIVAQGCRNFGFEGVALLEPHAFLLSSLLLAMQRLTLVQKIHSQQFLAALAFWSPFNGVFIVSPKV